MPPRIAAGSCRPLTPIRTAFPRIDTAAQGTDPFGLVLRGRRPEHLDFTAYTVPSGPALHVIDDPRMPFLAVHEAVDLDRLRPVRRMDAEYVNHATAIAHAVLTSPVPIRDVVVPGVSSPRGNPSCA